MATVLVLQLLLPTVLIAWLAVRPASTRIGWLRTTALALGAVAAASLVLPWVFVPGGLRYLLLGAWGIAAVRSWRRRGPARTPVRHTWTRVIAGIEIAVLGGLWFLAGLAVDGRRLPPGDVIDVACPLGTGSYLVASGGSRGVINPHLATLAAEPRYEPWRGQSYGVDLVQVDRLGRRASGLAPRNPAQYLIYGQAVLAPCAGKIVVAVDGRPDMPPGLRDPDRASLAGNHVMVRCGAVDVLLAHLQPGSVRVSTGDDVEAGDPIGFVGNSGNTDEPHLHISAQRPGDPTAPIGGDPVWLTIGGVLPVRNDRIECP